MSMIHFQIWFVFYLGSHKALLWGPFSLFCTPNIFSTLPRSLVCTFSYMQISDGFWPSFLGGWRLFFYFVGAKRLSSCLRLPPPYSPLLLLILAVSERLSIQPRWIEWIPWYLGKNALIFHNVHEVSHLVPLVG